MTALTVIGSVTVLVGLAAVALQSASGQRLDARAMNSVDGSSHTVLTLLTGLGTISIGTAGVGVALCVALALLRGRRLHAAGAVVLVAGASLATELLKHAVLRRPDHGFGINNSFPSGHTTVVVSLVLAALLVAPEVARLPIAVAGTAAATVTGASTVVANWHRPSDVLAAPFVALAWGALVVLVLGWCRPAPQRGRPRAGHGLVSATLELSGAALAGAALILLGVRPDAGWSDLRLAAEMLLLVGLTCAVCIGGFSRLSARFVA